MIEVSGLTKRFGKILAVDNLSFTVSPGHVTGFLGPNGAGKSTTMRMILGLDIPTSGSAHIGGRPYKQLPAPMREVGTLLDPAAVHKGRTARGHLSWLAQAGGIGPKRIDEVLELVGLTNSAQRRVGDFSLGMRQRLGLAAALLGDPKVLMLDEPLNGLDPQGIVWVRSLLQDLAAQGRTIFLSSHLMNEMEATADHVLVIGAGKLIADINVDELVRRGAGTRVQVHSPRANELAKLLSAHDAQITVDDTNEITVTGVEASTIGDIAAANQIPLHQLTSWRPRLEDAFMELTRDRGQHEGRGLNDAKEHSA